MPPRLVIMNRDGSAMELLRRGDVEDFKHLASIGAVKLNSSDDEMLQGDPQNQGGGKHRFYHIATRNPTESIFSVAFPNTAELPWVRNCLPVCARLEKQRDRALNGSDASSSTSEKGMEEIRIDMNPRAPAWVIAPTVYIRRVWHEIPALDDTGRAKLLRDIKQWADFRQEREKSVNRFAVQDDRIREEIDAEVSMQKQLKKVMKAAKAKRKTERAKAKAAEKRKVVAAAATAAAAKDGGSEAKNIAAAEPSIEVSNETEEEDDEELDSDEEKPPVEEEKDEFYLEVEAAYEERVVVQGQEDEIKDSDISSDLAVGIKYMPASELRGALVQVCNRGIKQDEARTMLENLPYRTFERDSEKEQISFDDFLRIAKVALSTPDENKMHANDQSAQAKTAESTIAARSIENMIDSVVVSDVGSFWNTTAGVKALAKTRPPPAPGAELYRPKQKGDILSFVGEPVPESLLPPGMFGKAAKDVDTSAALIVDAGSGQPLNGSQSMPSPMHEGQRKNMASSNSKSSSCLNMSPGPGEGGSFKVTDWYDRNVPVGSGEPGDNLHGADLQRLSAEELDTVAAGSGINAARAAALQRRDANERPRDYNIHGHGREKPVRGKERVKSREKLLSPAGIVEKSMATMEVNMKIENDADSFGGKAERTFECTPPRIDLGKIELESSNICEVVVNNAGQFAARFRVRNGNCSTVVDRPKGPVAAGMKAPLKLRCVPKDVGILNDIIKIVTEHEELQIVVTAEVIHKPTRLLGSNAIHADDLAR